MNHRIFLDYAATTPVLPEVVSWMAHNQSSIFGNPSSMHEEGRNSKALLENAREIISKAVNAEKDEIFFTSGGAESNGLALLGIARALKSRGTHIISTNIEHSTTLGTCKMLEGEGFEITYLPVNPLGLLDPELFRNAIRKETILASIMLANNEIGTIQPIEILGKIARDSGVFIHSDAVQAFTYLPINVQELCVDALSLSSHKIYGPKGTGGLYLRRGVPVRAFWGGSQERKVRPGTENVIGISGFGKAAEILMKNQQEEAPKVLKLRNQLKDELLKSIPECMVNGDLINRLPNNLNISFPHTEGESILIHLDINGIACSMGSACSAGSIAPSHVLLALGRSPLEAKSAVRFSLGKYTTEEEIAHVIKILPSCIKKLRETSPMIQAA